MVKCSSKACIIGGLDAAIYCPSSAVRNMNGVRLIVYMDDGRLDIDYNASISNVFRGGVVFILVFSNRY